MTSLKIVSYPAAVLTHEGKLVEQFDSALSQLAADMFETMYAAKGVGLAAPQVGISLRFFVIDCEGNRMVAANPVILAAEGEQSDEEACLSLGKIGAPLLRPLKVTIRADDLEGNSFEKEGVGLTARCLSHEIDHCDGLLFIDHLSPLRRDIIKRKFAKKAKR